MQASADATLIAANRRVPLGEDPVIVPAGPVVLELGDLPAADAARLDGRPLPLAFDSVARRGTVGLDLARETGFHQLTVRPDRRYLFGTQDAKLRIDGVAEMLDFLATQAQGLGLAWSGVLQFSGAGRVLRDPRLDVAWLERVGAEILNLGDAIRRAPRSRSVVVKERADHGVPDLTASLSLLRRNPHLLEEFPNGPITVGDGAWIPRQIVRRRRVSSSDTPGNRAATRLLSSTLALTKASMASAPQPVAEGLAELARDLGRLLRCVPFRTLYYQRRHMRVAGIQGDERRDPRYRRVRQLLAELLQERQWDPSTAVTEKWAFVAVADRVYQTFAALMVAHALDLQQIAPLDAEGPHFGNDRYWMWIDRAPPADVLVDWRSNTSRPSTLRPDITVLDRREQRVAILDAKYRTNDDRATTESLAEVQLYLQAYDQPGAMVLYPPQSSAAPWPAHEIADGHYRLIEMPLRPGPGLEDHAKSTVLPAILSLMAPTAASRIANAEEAAELAGEPETAAGQDTAVQTLLTTAAVVELTQPHAMTATERRLERSLAGVWTGLGDEIQRMLITAEFFGDQVPIGYDYSGPVLGVFAACERLITDRVFGPLGEIHPQEFDRVTLGQAAYLLKALRRPRSDLAVELLRRYLAENPEIDARKLSKCGGVLLGINRWRQAAAHAQLVGRAIWDSAHTAIIGDGSGLLRRIAEALGSPTI